ncbi:MAG: hypothetical protein ACE363_03815 [Alphaproteobacteria bacterium]
MSMQTKGEAVDLSGIVEGAEAVDDRVPHGKVLARFAEAVISGSDNAIAHARHAVIEVVGGDGFVDAAAVVGNFERMVRVADATGIPLDETATDATTDIRQDLGLNEYGMAGRTLGEERG